MIDRYCKALWSMNENEKINLTRHTNYDLFVRRDLIGFVSVGQVASREREILDVGTGGGVPGVLVAILRPDVQVSLCDSVQKKAKAVSGHTSRSSTCRFPFMSNRYRPFWKTSRLIP